MRAVSGADGLQRLPRPARAESERPRDASDVPQWRPRRAGPVRTRRGRESERRGPALGCAQCATAGASTWNFQSNDFDSGGAAPITAIHARIPPLERDARARGKPRRRALLPARREVSARGPRSTPVPEAGHAEFSSAHSLRPPPFPERARIGAIGLPRPRELRGNSSRAPAARARRIARSPSTLTGRGRPDSERPHTATPTRARHVSAVTPRPPLSATPEPAESPGAAPYSPRDGRFQRGGRAPRLSPRRVTRNSQVLSPFGLRLSPNAPASARSAFPARARYPSQAPAARAPHRPIAPRP